MHQRRVAAYLIGLWMGACILMSYTAWQNLLNSERVVVTPSAGAAKLIEKIGQEPARMMVMYATQEQTRHHLVRWEWMQVLLWFVLGSMLLLGTHLHRLFSVLCGLIIVVVGFQHFFLTPEIIWLGREQDFLSPATTSHTRTWVLHGLYFGLELVKVLMASGLLAYLFLVKSRTRVSLKEEDLLSRTARA